jgi:putative FmdB family regulatory protein
MPVYEYECMKCGRVVEAYQKFSDSALKKCRQCSGKLNKCISHSSFHLKGTGWYVTDYGNKSVADKSSSKKEKTDTVSKSKNKGEKTESKSTCSKKEP